MAYGRAFDTLSVSLQDHDLQEELDLLMELVLAANESDGPLSSDVIDRLLGVSRPTIVSQRSADDFANRALVGVGSQSQPSDRHR
jgi:hypothetical protein